MKKNDRPAVTREIRQTGVNLYEVQTIDPDAPGGMEALRAMLRAATPAARLAKVRQRAKQYASIDDVQREIVEIEGVIEHPEFRQAVPYMLLAIERGLDLLDTGRYLTPIRRDKKRQDGTRKERRPEINAWIAQEIARTPTARSPELWRRAPVWITDQIGERSFAVRVTQQRKATRK